MPKTVPSPVSKPVTSKPALTRQLMTPVWLLAASLAATSCTAVGAQEYGQGSSAISQPTYADLAQLADGAPLVLRALVKQQAEVDRERAPGLPADKARLYVEAETLSLIAGNVPVGESLKYLVDVPLDARGKVPKLKKREMILFARPVPGRGSEIQLVSESAQLPWSAETEQRLRPILAELASAGAPPRVDGVRDALSVAGNLTGESETQLFLSTQSGRPASITVVRRPGMEPGWGVSWTEIVDRSASQPARNTLAWYRLACALPSALPAEANLSDNDQDRSRAARDYAYVINALGPCPRSF